MCRYPVMIFICWNDPQNHEWHQKWLKDHVDASRHNDYIWNEFKNNNIMITAIILINTEKNQVNTVGAQLAALEGVDEVYSVSGRYDLIALIRLKNIEDLARLATEQISKIAGITNTESMVAFKKISPGDIAGMFDLGS